MKKFLIVFLTSMMILGILPAFGSFSLAADEKKVADQIMPRVVHAVTQAVATAQTQIGAMPDAGNGSQV